jgi:uncharacterized protein
LGSKSDVRETLLALDVLAQERLVGRISVNRHGWGVETAWTGEYLTLLSGWELDTRSVLMYDVFMNSLRFEWDEAKNRANRRKHGVSFEEAQTVFFDGNAIRYFDPDHSTDEDRFIMLGMSWSLRVLVVCHCFRVADSIIRIISARKANKSEAGNYYEVEP